MKNTFGLLTLFATCLCLAVPAGAFAQSEQGRFYIKGDIGGNYTADTDLKEFFGPVDPGTKVKFDPGFRFGVHGGYNVTDWFAPEAEFGFMHNWTKEITGATRVHDASFMNAPFLVNARFQWLNQTRVVPYIGGGAGFSAAIFDVDAIQLNNTLLSGSQATAVFAYQGFAGLRVKINDNIAVGLEYRYFATEDPQWKTDVTFGTPSDKMKFGGTQTHAVSLTFDYTF